jgi:hypothetical protein
MVSLSEEQLILYWEQKLSRTSHTCKTILQHTHIHTQHTSPPPKRSVYTSKIVLGASPQTHTHTIQASVVVSCSHNTRIFICATHIYTFTRLQYIYENVIVDDGVQFLRTSSMHSPHPNKLCVRMCEQLIILHVYSFCSISFIFFFCSFLRYFFSVFFFVMRCDENKNSHLI